MVLRIDFFVNAGNAGNGMTVEIDSKIMDFVLRMNGLTIPAIPGYHQKTESIDLADRQIAERLPA